MVVIGNQKWKADAAAPAKPEVIPWFKIGTEPGLRFLKEQLSGLELLQDKAPRARILDLGCAEGLIGKYYIDTFGADLVHGIEVDELRVDQARELCSGYENARFWVGNLNDLDKVESEAELLEQYDIVLVLAIIHKLKDPRKVLLWAARRSARYIAVRLPHASPEFRDARSGDQKIKPIDILATEFKLIQYRLGPRNEWTGIWERL